MKVTHSIFKHRLDTLATCRFQSYKAGHLLLVSAITELRNVVKSGYENSDKKFIKEQTKKILSNHIGDTPNKDFFINQLIRNI